MSNRETVYWDSDCFLGWLKGEQDKVKVCRGAAKKAERGELTIVTSAITLIEVIKLQHENKVRLPATEEKKIRKFFLNPYIYIYNLDREIAVEARDLIWKHNLSQRDSIHISTALKLNLGKMHTFDAQLHGLSNKYGKPLLKICKPDIEYQTEFDDLNDEQKE